MSRFEDTFWKQLNEFRDLQQKKADRVDNPWHRRIDKHTSSKNQKQVADRYEKRHVGGGKFKYSGELNDKIEAIRSGDSSIKPLSDIDIKYILKNYSTNELPKDQPKRIFAGVVVFWDPIKSQYFIKSDDK